MSMKHSVAVSIEHDLKSILGYTAKDLLEATEAGICADLFV